MNVLFLAAEASPFVKVGGLADVAGELPQALRALGLDVRLALPFHPALRRQIPEPRTLIELDLPMRDSLEKATLYSADLDGSLAYLIDGGFVQASEEIYVAPDVDTWKFTFSSLAAMYTMEALGWQPDLLHAHDWHAAPAVVWLSQNRQSHSFWRNTASLLTVHNLPYMGTGGIMSEFGIISEPRPNLPQWGENVPLPAGLSTADRINAVSPTYAQEIQTPEFGHGLEGLLVHRTADLSGVLNGIDTTNWDPFRDTSLPVNFSRTALKRRRELKSSLLRRVGLPERPGVPLLGMVTRLDWQKGVDLAIELLSQLTTEDWQFILLGTGDPTIEKQVLSFADRFPAISHIHLGFDTKLAREMYAGLDMILIPSRYEPCGLTQMIAMRYGCVPVVSETGGLKDTVIDFRTNPAGTGFVFKSKDPHDAQDALRTAFETYRDQRRWRGLQLRGMATDFSWANSANEYLTLYQKTIAQWRASKEE